jgi:hypothetical protein
VSREEFVGPSHEPVTALAPTYYQIKRRWELKTSELSTTQKREARAFLYGSFGQTKCYFTGRPIVPQLLHAGAYDIHHILPRGSPGSNLLPNLSLALHGPNANASKPPGIQISDRDKSHPTPPIDPTVQLREVVDYSSGSREMQANAESEPVYRAWLWERLLMENRVTKDTAIWAGAEKVGVSGQATRDYLKKLTSETGPFEEFKENGIKLVRIKPGRLE